MIRVAEGTLLVSVKKEQQPKAKATGTKHRCKNHGSHGSAKRVN